MLLEVDPGAGGLDCAEPGVSGEDEMLALAQGALRVLRGESSPASTEAMGSVPSRLAIST
jgi:hypothetical protein